MRLDDRRKWLYTVEGDGGKIIVWDRVEDCFSDLDEVQIGVGCYGWVQVVGSLLRQRLCRYKEKCRSRIVIATNTKNASKETKQEQKGKVDKQVVA